MKEALPSNDAWDWVFLYYVGTVILKMSPRLFWSCTPCRFNLLVGVHADLNGDSKKKKSAPKQAYIDDII